jgi:TIR domain-containing protein
VRIFLSYRRDDASGHAGRLYDALAAKFGDENVFIDVDTIGPGVDFAEAIGRAVAACDAVIALIGREWLTASNAGGGRRLDDPQDFVRLELEAALEREVTVIPAFVQQAQPPPADRLPASLAPLARRQGAELRDVGWRDDVNRLIARLEHEQAGPRSARPRHRLLRPLPLVIAAAVLLAAAAAGILIAANRSRDGDDGGSVTQRSFPTATERRLLSWIPSVTRASCRRTQAEPVALASVGCSGARLFVAYHAFPDKSDLDAWYIQRRELQKIAPESGSCEAARFHGETGLAGGGEGAKRICYIDSTDEPYIVWTDPRAVVGAVANIWEGTGRSGVESLLRQWRCCLGLEPPD